MNDLTKTSITDYVRARKPSISGDIKINVMFSGSKAHRNDEKQQTAHYSDEENDNVRIQRQLFKSYKAAELNCNGNLQQCQSPAKTPVKPTEKVENAGIFSNTDSHALMLTPNQSYEPENFPILIQDFQFMIHSITVALGDTIEFLLSSNVPLHAEHIIYGISCVDSLCFESPLLQVSLLSIALIYILTLLLIIGIIHHHLIRLVKSQNFFWNQKQ